MATNWMFLFLLAVSLQTKAQTTISTGSTRAQSYSSGSSRSYSTLYSSGVGNKFPKTYSPKASIDYGSRNTVELKELRNSQTTLQASLSQQSSALLQVKNSFEQQIAGWYFQSPDLRTAFDEAISIVSDLVEQATQYANGAQRLLEAMETAGSGIKSEWIDRVRKLQALVESLLKNAADGIAEVLRNIEEIAEDQSVYNEAKSQQLIETKAAMDKALEQLLQQTLQVGIQASGIINQALKEWSVILRNHLGASEADPAIARLSDLSAQTLADLARLRPEDIETAMNDAHRTIDDIKGLFYSYGVPAAVVRTAVNPVQLGVFATLTRARNIHT